MIMTITALMVMMIVMVTSKKVDVKENIDAQP